MISKIGENTMGRWFTSLPILISLIICSTLAEAQKSPTTDDSFESRVEQTSDNFEEFVDGLVNNVEIGVSRMFESRQQYSDSDNFTEDEKKSATAIDAVTFNGNTEIALNDSIQTDLLIKNGNLTVYGTVLGSILVINGDIDLRSSSKVMGNVRAMNGKIIKENGSFVEGFTEQSAGSTVKKHGRRNINRTKYTYSFKPYFWNDDDILDDNVLFRYNRVEGLFLGFGTEKKVYWDGSKSVSGAGSFGYGFSSHKWRLQLGLDRQFAVSDDILYEAGGEVHSTTDSKDDWIMNLSENNLAALFFHEDFKDYYQREGYSVHTARYSKDGYITTMIDVRYNDDRYASLDNKATWALFGGNSFRSNPSVSDGKMKSFSVAGGLSTIEKYRYHSEGWNLFVRGEYGGKGLGGDFDFTQALIDIRRFQPLSDDDQINLRIRVGALEGSPIAQKNFELGGANTIPAFGFKEFSGNRMVLTNLEYRVSSDIIDEIFFWPNSLNLIAFGDAGAVASVNTKWAVYEGFNSLRAAQFKSDYGFAIAWHDGDARLGFAWRTDKQAPVSIFFRLNRSF
ncbi:MAG: BamA/TamA family outer membrane protein [Bacteroidota bacterium]